MPSALEHEDAFTLLDIMELRTYARAKELVEQADTDEDMLKRAGLSDALISAVMANIERASRNG